MKQFRLYLANARGQKLSAYEYVNASSFSEARKILRQQMGDKWIDWSAIEILGEGWI